MQRPWISDARVRTADNLTVACSAAISRSTRAKLELINSAGGVFLSGVTDLPFGQALGRQEGQTGGGGGRRRSRPRCAAREYWQKRMWGYGPSGSDPEHCILTSASPLRAV